ncbi:MAG: enoyl-CoA hydratase-related protein [Nakamurella sp.]
MPALVHADQVGGFNMLVLDSPANRNALSLQLLNELTEQVSPSGTGPGRGLVLTHTGTTFCSGVDLRERRSLGDADTSHSRLLGELLVKLWKYPKPIVTVVSGAVRGGGMGLLACSDIVIAAPDSTFAYSETRVGVAPALVMAVTLPAVVGRPMLAPLLTGAVFDAHKARELGLVTAIDDQPVRGIVRKIVTELSAGAPEAQAAVKRLLRATQNVDIDRLITAMIAESAAQFRSAEAHEGMAAFAERRPPNWKRSGLEFAAERATYEASPTISDIHESRR